MENREQKVSVIIPAYNCEDTIEKCLNSILQQTYQNIEVIVINDGSQDHTAEILDKYQQLDTRVVVIHKENSGVSETRNLGIEKSTGSYICFVDADDWIENNMVEEMLKAINENHVDFVRCNQFNDYRDGTQITKRMYELANKKYNNEEIYTQHVVDHFLFHEKAMMNLVMLLLIKKEMLTQNAIYFEKELYMLEDVYFYQRLFKNAQSVYFLDKPLYHYYENEKSITRNIEKSTKVVYGVIDANRVITKYLIEHRLNSIDLEKMNANHLKMIYNYLKNMCISCNKSTFIDFMQNLQKNDEYNRILNNMNDLNFKIKHKIQLKVMHLKNNNIKYFFLKSVATVWKIKNRKRNL